MTIHHILVPVDFSEYSDQALETALELASKLHARITLLHVYHDMPIGAGDMASALPYTYIEEVEAEIRQRLESQLEQIRKTGLDGESMIMHGVPFQVIIGVAHDKKADLIVMGTHGRTGIKHVLLGSVAEKVVRLSPCPVLVAREESSSSE